MEGVIMGGGAVMSGWKNNKWRCVKDDERGLMKNKSYEK
jgi:hypothetical protein